MPRNRTKYQAKREHELTAGELLDVCGPSWEAMKRDENPSPSRRERKRARRVMTRWERIGTRVTAIRAARRLAQPDGPDLEAA